MTDTTLTSKQPNNLDFADPTKFRFQMTKIPKVEYNTISANVPGVDLTELTQPTRLQQLKLPGNDLTFSDLTITFIVDEDLITYRSIHDWMAGLAQMDSDEKFQNLLAAGADRMPGSQSRGIQTEPGKTGEISFRDCYPKSLSALEYNQNATDVEYLTASVTFGYKYHEYSTPF